MKTRLQRIQAKLEAYELGEIEYNKKEVLRLHRERRAIIDRQARVYQPVIGFSNWTMNI